MSKISKIIIFATCFLTIISAHLIAASKQTKHYDNYHFIYEEGDSIYVNKLVLKIKNQLLKIEDFFNYKPQSIITIILTRSDAEYDLYRKNTIPEWSQAVALTKEKIIILKIESAEAIKRSPEILLHELVHIFFENKTKYRKIPVWLHEGIAQYLSGYELTINDRIHLANALVSDNIISLTSMDTMFHFNQVKARLAYIESLTAIQFIVKKHGVEALKRIIHNMSNDMSVNQAFMTALGYDFIDFEIYWYEELSSQNRWLIILNFENLLWISIVLLAIMVIILIKLKNRRLQKSWEDEIESIE